MALLGHNELMAASIALENIIILRLASMKLKGGYTGFTLSVRPSTHLSIRPFVHLLTESCPLCIFNNTRRIPHIFAHLIKQLQKVCGM